MSDLSQLQEESGRNSIFSLYQPWLQTVQSVQWHCGCWSTFDILKCVLEHPLTVSSIAHVQMPQNFPLDLQRGSREHSEKKILRVARPPMLICTQLKRTSFLWRSVRQTRCSSLREFKTGGRFSFSQMLQTWDLNPIYPSKWPPHIYVCNNEQVHSICETCCEYRCHGEQFLIQRRKTGDGK